MLNHNKTANGGLVFSYSIFSYQKLLSFLFVCSLQAFPIFVRQSTVAIRKSPGIRMIHQDPVISALSDRDSILPQVITSIGRPIPIKLKVASEIIAVLPCFVEASGTKLLLIDHVYGSHECKNCNDL